MPKPTSARHQSEGSLQSVTKKDMEKLCTEQREEMDKRFSDQAKATKQLITDQAKVTEQLIADQAKSIEQLLADQAPLQKGDQERERRGGRWTWLAELLIVHPMWDT